GWRSQIDDGIAVDRRFRPIGPTARGENQCYAIPGQARAAGNSQPSAVKIVDARSERNRGSSVESHSSAVNSRAGQDHRFGDKAFLVAAVESRKREGSIWVC